LRQAKRNRKIPKGRQPFNTKKQDQINLGRRGIGAPGKIYKFKDVDGKEVIIEMIQKAIFSKDGAELPSHFNVGKDHYFYDISK